MVVRKKGTRKKVKKTRKVKTKKKPKTFAESFDNHKLDSRWSI